MRPRKRQRGAPLRSGVYARGDGAAVRVVRTRGTLRAVALEDASDCADVVDGAFVLRGGARYEAAGDGALVDGTGASWDLAAPLAAEFYFDAPSAAFAACVRSRGVAVLRGALAADEVDVALAGVWAWLERSSAARRRDPATWTGPPFDEAHGVAFLAGQCEGSWAVRSAAGVAEAFARLWGDDDLICSMEPLLLWRPWKEFGDARRTRGGWLHYDDGEPVAALGAYAAQGLASLTRADGSTGGFVVVPDSHASDAIAARPRWRYVGLAPGDLVLWDSRTLHASEPGCDATAYDEGALLRVAVPVCMVPRSAATPAALRARGDLRDRGGTSTHRPHRPDLTFAEGIDPPCAPAALADAARRLL